MSPEREHRIREVISRSQPDLTVILENIYDPLNISAVLRSCDAVGVREIFVVYTQEYLAKRNLKVGKKTSGGAFKWIDVYIFEDLDECFKRVRERYNRILVTRLGAESKSLYDLDLTVSTALLFGNEKEGVSAKAMDMADGNFLIPQIGFTDSLNISVACAVTLFEARRQRDAKGFYDGKNRFTPEEQEQLFQRWENMQAGKAWSLRYAIPVSKDSAPLLPIHLERDESAPKRKKDKTRSGTRTKVER